MPLRAVRDRLSHGKRDAGAGPSDFNLYQNWRNSIWVVAKNYPVADVLLHAPALGYVQLRNLLIAVRRGRVRVWLRAWHDALRAMPDLLTKRREVQHKRRVDRRALHAVIGRMR